jgi:uncharacterized OB-fold protein
MNNADSRDGVVFTETIVHAPTEQFAADVPYQLAIIDLDRGGRVTVRVLGKTADERARIGDRIRFVEERNGVPYYERAETEA